MEQRTLRLALSDADLIDENQRFAYTAGVSKNNRSAGFEPAYRDETTGRVVRSLFADGSPAPIHVLEGLPDDWVVERDGSGAIVKIIASVVPGFLRDGQFYTRGEAHVLARLARV